MDMSFIRCSYRLFLFACALMLYFILAIICIVANFGDINKSRKFLINLVSLISQFGLYLFGARLKSNIESLDKNKNYLFVSNHMSYLDILAISSVLRTSYVTSLEMKRTPFLGQLCTLGGCLFVDRKNKRGISREVAHLKNVLNFGVNITIFPEAKSTNGEKVHMFKRPLFQSALDSNIDIIPVCLNYKKLDGEKITKKNRDYLFWYDDMSFFPHAIKLFSKKSFEMELTFFEPVLVADIGDKTLLAEKCFNIISQQYTPID